MPRKTPSRGRGRVPAGLRFNEAAARCRGKRTASGAEAIARSGFNEAAARCRGKRPTASGRSSAAIFCFNEAAARCRGKPRSSRSPHPVTVTGFNEAAARCRGKPTRVGRTGSRRCDASMRPRPDAAENSHGPPPSARTTETASMRPRPDAAENVRLAGLPSTLPSGLQ